MSTLKIVQDTSPANPRTEFDNFGLMNCEHPHYNFGDKNFKEILFTKLGIFDRSLDSRELIKKATAKGLIFHSMPIYIYEHGNIALSTSPFSCQWDSGQLGEIIVFNDDIKKEFSIKRFTKKNKEEILQKVIKKMESEVEIYGQYVSGEVYGFKILDEEGDVIDSCYGFYGNDFETNGIKENLPEEFHSELKNIEVSYDWKRNVWKKSFKRPKYYFQLTSDHQWQKRPLFLVVFFYQYKIRFSFTFSY